MSTNPKRDIDDTIEDTFPASDAPQFTDESKKPQPVERYLHRLEELRGQNVTTEQKEKVDNLEALVAGYERGSVSESEVLEAIETVEKQMRSANLVK